MLLLITLLAVLFILIFLLIFRVKRPSIKQKKAHKKNVRHFDNAQKLLKGESPLKEAPLKNTPINSLNSTTPKALLELKIIQSGMIDEETYAYATQIIDSIKRPHPALHALTANMTTEALLDLMQGCPDITAKILTTVNSASFGLLTPITSIKHAVIYLGVGIVKSITLQFVLKESLGKNDPKQARAFKKLWRASYVNSALTFLMAESLSNPAAAELSTKALLNTVGSFALLAYDANFAALYEAEPSLLNRTLTEQKIYALNSSVIGSLLAKKWKLPTVMVDAISHSLFTLDYKKLAMTVTNEEEKNIIFCYFMCRIGDEAIYNNLTHIEDFSLEDKSGFDYFYLQEALNKAELTPCLQMMKNPLFIKKANKILKQAL